jgi:hypothetical protein
LIEAVLAIQFFGGDGRKTQNSKENQIPFSWFNHWSNQLLYYGKLFVHILFTGF